MLFSQKIEIVGSSKCIKTLMCFPSEPGAQGEGAELWCRGKQCGRTPAPRAGEGRLFPGLLWLLPKQPLPLMQFKKLHNGGKNKRALVD